MSNILDKPLESVFGYITVPGTFAAYRYIGIQNERSCDSGPLYKYILARRSMLLKAFSQLISTLKYQN
jgi:cellulose synthase/poly-beta-1,6-N-acetylglucosamine synthase-like glycosyltransferase